MFTRLKSIYGDVGLARLQGARVAVAGLGGVGSYCAAAICRGGVGHMVLVDCDTIEESNINRQLFALHSTIGKAKTDVAAKMLADINPDCDVRVSDAKIAAENVEEIFAKIVTDGQKISAEGKKIVTDSENLDQIFSDKRRGVDFIIDCVDDVPAKIAMAQYAEREGVKIVSCMGTALRKDASALQFADLFETSVCPLCRVMRHEARAAGVKQLRVLYSTEKPVASCDGQLGSTSYLPPIAGMMLAGHVIERIAGGDAGDIGSSN